MKSVARIPLAPIPPALALLIAACATPGTEVTALPVRIDYACAGERTLVVLRAPDGRSAAVLVGEREFVLARTDGGAQEKYSDGRLTLYLDGERAMLEDLGRVLYGPCESAVPLPTVYR
jgi:membrane-bound inhibitor of C-type lysozyme